MQANDCFEPIADPVPDLVEVVTALWGSLAPKHPFPEDNQHATADPRASGGSPVLLITPSRR